MTLQELYDRIGLQLRINNRYRDFNVYVWTSDKSIGPHSSSMVESCGAGIDWDSGKYFLFPVDELVRRNK